MCLFISRANMIHLFSLLLTKDMLLSLSCPVDYEILGPFEYSGSKTTAAVRFQAHKFPYTASVYYSATCSFVSRTQTAALVWLVQLLRELNLIYFCSNLRENKINTVSNIMSQSSFINIALKLAYTVYANCS